jgi:predicted nucleotidyltransferase
LACGVWRFGSAVSGGFNDESDLDFLVEFDLETWEGYADRYFGLLESLEELFGRPIDLLSPRAIKNPYLKESIDRTKTLLYAA